MKVIVFIKRNVGVMEVRGDSCRILPVPLKTMRPFVMADISLEDHFERDVDLADIEDFLEAKVKKHLKNGSLTFSKLHTQYSNVTIYT